MHHLVPKYTIVDDGLGALGGLKNPFPRPAMNEVWDTPTAVHLVVVQGRAGQGQDLMFAFWFPLCRSATSFDGVRVRVVRNLIHPREN